METVGEVYMVASGLPETCFRDGKPDHARRIANLALDMINTSQFVLVHEKGGVVWDFMIRIGCNTGN